MYVAKDKELIVMMQLLITAIVFYRSARSALVEVQPLNHGRYIRQAPVAGASIVDIAFDLSDITTSFQLPTETGHLEAFKYINNDKLQQGTTGTMTSQLRWVSYGLPTLKKTRDHVNASEKFFHFSDSGFSTHIDMMTQDQRSALALAAQRKYEITIQDDQIVNLILSKFQCTLTLEDEAGRKYPLIGKVAEFRRFPLRMKFAATRRSIERKVFLQSLTDAGGHPDLHFDCHIEAGGGKVIKTNTLTITSDQQEQLGFDEKLFGAAGGNDSNNAYVTRNQMSELSHEMYSTLNIIEEYEIPETQFSEEFVSGLISQLASSSFAPVPIDIVLASLSKYGFDIKADLQPDVIKRNLGSILKVDKKNDKSRIVLATSMSGTAEDSTGGSAGLSVDLGAFSVSANAAYEWSQKRALENKSLSDQLNELNTYSQNDVQYEIEGNRVVPKSLNVARITRSKLKKTLTFNRIRIQKSQASFERNFQLDTKSSRAFASSEQIGQSVWKNLSSAIANNGKTLGHVLYAIETANVGTRFAHVLSAIRAENIGTNFAQVLSAVMALQKSSCPSGFKYSMNGIPKCYYVDNEPLNWNAASAKCNRLHPKAHLVVINSALEDQVIAGILENHECPTDGWNGWFWTGGRRTSEDCNSPIQWRPTYRDYQPLVYTNFCPGNPDCRPNNPWYCLSVVKDCWARRNTYGWQDDGCSHMRCAICEILKFD